MFYKFMGGDEGTLLDVFEKAVLGGSIKFTSALHLNDPSEFKFVSVAPTRPEFDQWHRTYDANRTEGDLDNAWRSFSGPAKDFNTSLWPRAQLMRNLFVLCLARRWDSHVMWAHYAAGYRGFVVCYRPELIDTLVTQLKCENRKVVYSDQVPEMRWFSASPSEMMAPIVATKSSEWFYEQEHRVLMCDPAGKRAIFKSVDPNLITGVLLGARASAALVDKALALQANRKDFTVERVSTSPGSFELVAQPVNLNERISSNFL